MIILYVTILLKLKSHEIPGEPSVNAEKQRMKRERNVVKMSIAIVLAFATCRLPYTISHLLSFFSSDNSMISSCGFKYFAYIALFLAHSHCAINPWICYNFCGNYRQGLKNFLSCGFLLVPGLIKSGRHLLRSVQTELI